MSANLTALASGQQYQLLDWLSNITFPMEVKFADERFADEVYRSVVKRFIDSGVSCFSCQPFNRLSLSRQTTTCCYYATLHLESTKRLAEIVHEYGTNRFELVLQQSADICD